MPTIPRARCAVLAIIAAAIAYAAPFPGVGWNQGSHYALIESLDRGTARIDRFLWLTGDVAWVRGHYYSTKAPGLALATLPAYATLEATGATRAIAHGTATRSRAARITIWVLHLWTVVLPAVILLLLVWSVAERIAPGLGAVTALTLGLGTLVLPFASLFFAHVLSACLGFAAFALLWRERNTRERSSRGRLGLPFAAGVLVGLAISVEYSLAIVALALALYAVIGTAKALRRSLVYGLGCGLGILPLLLYNRLAFGSIRHVSYADAVSTPGSSGHAELGANTTGFYGVSFPSPRVAGELLLGSRGVLTLAPVLAMSLAGLLLLYRKGWRAEALTIALVGLGFLLFNAGYFLPFGGWVPGPRLLVPALPFVAVPVAAAYRRYPGCTLALAAASVAMLVTATATQPMLPDGDTSRWASLAANGDFQDTVATFGGAAVQGWLVVLPFLIPIVVAVVLVVLATPPLAIERSDARAALFLLLGWALVASLVPRLGHAPGFGAAILVAGAAGVGALALATTRIASRHLKPVDASAPIGSSVGA